MDDLVPATPGPPRPHLPHDWLNYDQYLSVHANLLRRLEDEGIVLDARLSFLEHMDADGRLERVDIEGRVRCADGVSLHVRKSLDARTRRDGRPEVRGFIYNYQAWRAAGGERRLLFRYDGAHGAPLHLHAADPSTGEETDRIEVSPGELRTSTS